MYKHYNPNPVGRASVGDCSVRAVAKALNTDWEKAFLMIVANAFQMGDVISSNSVWGAVLRQNGFYRENLPMFCKDCYTIRDFARDNQIGTYVVGTGNHVVTIVNGARASKKGFLHGICTKYNSIAIGVPCKMSDDVKQTCLNLIMTIKQRYKIDNNDIVRQTDVTGSVNPEVWHDNNKWLNDIKNKLIDI